MLRFPRLLSLLLVLGIEFVSAALQVSAATTEPGQNVMQMLADAVAIDAECGTWNTMFGVVFRYGEEHGIHAVDIMPLGKRREEFQAAYSRRMGTTARNELCGPIQERYHRLFPDWFSRR